MFSWFNKSCSGLPISGRDWSHVDSPEKAAALVEIGDLVALQLLPDAFGGDRNEHNLVYVPPCVVHIKQGIDANSVTPLVEEGQIQRYMALPRYEGKSLVPRAIEIHASDPADFRALVKIWGTH